MENEWVEILNKQNKTISNYIGKLSFLKHSLSNVSLEIIVNNNIDNMNKVLEENFRIINLIINQKTGE